MSRVYLQLSVRYCTMLTEIVVFLATIFRGEHGVRCSILRATR
jgi:hypothetical protein